MEHLDTRVVTGFDDLDDRARQLALEHAAVCAACRRRLTADDPARAFALLALQPIPEAAFGKLSARLDAELDRVAAAPSRGRWVSIAGVAASLLLAALLVGTSLRFGTPRENAGAGLPAPFETAVIQEWLDATTPVEGVEILSSRGGDADVFEMALGEDTQLVMIFDEALEL